MFEVAVCACIWGADIKSAMAWSHDYHQKLL